MEYDVRTRVCVLSDEDSTSKKDDMRTSTSNDNIYFELQCFDGGTYREIVWINPDKDI